MSEQLARHYETTTPQPTDAGVLNAFVAHRRVAEYSSPEFGMDDTWAREVLDELINPVAIAKRAADIERARRQPSRALYRFAKGEGYIAAVLRAERDEDGLQELHWLFVKPELKGQGFGSRLMEDFFEWADLAQPIELDVVTYNEPAIGFWQHQGFEISSGVQDKYQVPTYRMQYKGGE